MSQNKTHTSDPVESIYSTLFERIVHGLYSEGVWLRENDLAEEFGYSRSPVRKVLQQLHQDKLIELVPNKGARVLGFTADDVEDIYDIRKALEPLALQVGAQRMSIEQLFDINRQVMDLELTDNPHEHARVDAALHDYLLENSGRPKLTSMVNELYRLLERFRELSLQDAQVRRDTNEEHSRIIYALLVRDVSRASEALVRHIENSKLRILTGVLPQQRGQNFTNE